MRAEMTARKKVIYRITGLMLLFLPLSTIANYLNDRTAFSILYLFSFAATLLHLYRFRLSHDLQQASERIMTILFGLFFAFFLIGEQSTFDVFWLLTLPVVAVILESHARLYIWLRRMIVALTVMLLLAYFRPEWVRYEPFALWSLLWALIFVSMLVLHYRKIQETLEEEIAAYQTGLEQKIAKAVEEIQALNDDLDATQIEIIERLGTLGEYRSKETGMHVRRVGLYTKTLALMYGIDPAEADVLERAAPLHDIGKVGIEDSILHKPAKLTAEEFERMKCHTLIGESILGGSDKPLLQLASEIAGGHHEKFDGSGYPRGLSGDAIPISARLTAIADVFDALFSRRSYKKGWSKEEVIDYFTTERGRHFDPQLVDLLLARIDTFIAIFNANKDTEGTKEVPCTSG